MQPRIEQIRTCLQAFEFRKLFIQELGWDKHSTNLPVAVDGKVFDLHGIAEKRGMQVFELVAPSTEFPDYDGRRKIERQVAKLAHEHIIIYTDADKTVQKWQWVRREAGRPLACREPSFEKGQSGEALVQKLQILAVALDEEEKLSLVEVTGRAKKAFDVDRVTKRFYDRFKTEHTNFLSFIKGITEKADREWYASLMLNRLMFIYFIQKKGFLDGDLDYLRNRLHTVQERKGKDKFLTFYQYFLLRLFHEGLGKPKAERNWKKDLETLIGEVPYLNGGLFDVHQLEKANPEIRINDDAFERLFDFFDAYEWHLDDRPLHKDNQINPDVLGYIFEKYINQKQMGAYYTKEDITGYIARNTIIPFLFNAAEKDCDIAFRPESVVWRLLSDDPNRYIYPAVGYQTFDTKNLYPYVYERSLKLGKSSAFVGFIVQLTVLSAERLDSLQRMLLDRGRLCAVSFPRRPESVFDGVEMPVAILLSSPSPSPILFTSRVSRFYTEERPHALKVLRLQEHNIRRSGHRIAKFGSDVEVGIHSNLAGQSAPFDSLTKRGTKWLLYYQEACRYWVKASVGMPFFKRNGEKTDPPHGRTITFASQASVAFAACLANSSLFYWFYSAFSDCEHINDALLREFPIPDNWSAIDWADLNERLSADLRANAKRKVIQTKQGHTIEYNEMKALLSKDIIDDVDRNLGRAYGLSDEQLDFLVNYDCKYRTGTQEEVEE